MCHSRYDGEKKSPAFVSGSTMVSSVLSCVYDTKQGAKRIKLLCRSTANQKLIRSLEFQWKFAQRQQSVTKMIIMEKSK